MVHYHLWCWIAPFWCLNHIFACKETCWPLKSNFCCPNNPPFGMLNHHFDPFCMVNPPIWQAKLHHFPWVSHGFPMDFPDRSKALPPPPGPQRCWPSRRRRWRSAGAFPGAATAPGDAITIGFKKVMASYDITGVGLPVPFWVYWTSPYNSI